MRRLLRLASLHFPFNLGVSRRTENNTFYFIYYARTKRSKSTNLSRHTENNTFYVIYYAIYKAFQANQLVGNKTQKPVEKYLKLSEQKLFFMNIYLLFGSFSYFVLPTCLSPPTQAKGIFMYSFCPQVLMHRRGAGY
jgi:hypothetical protein